VTLTKKNKSNWSDKVLKEPSPLIFLKESIPLISKDHPSTLQIKVLVELFLERPIQLKINKIEELKQHIKPNFKLLLTKISKIFRDR
jgi:hypothetical protein